MLKQFSAGVVIYRIGENNERTYLVLQYPKGPWDFPKGKLQSDERWRSGAHREALEETGVDLDLDKDFEHSYAYTFNDSRGNRVEKTVMFFVAKAEMDAQITLSQEHVDYLWLPYHQARMQLPFENIRHLLDQAEKFLAKKYGSK
jgi:8-oxo-dGTP pyrophosphatase MutT (NUDIX family)